MNRSASLSSLTIVQLLNARVGDREVLTSSGFVRQLPYNQLNAASHDCG